MSFFLAGAEQQLPDHSLIKINRLLDWSSIRSALRGIHRCDVSGAGGREPYDVVLMFKLAARRRSQAPVARDGRYAMTGSGVDEVLHRESSRDP